MSIEGITATQDIGIYVDEQGVAQVFETPGGRGQSAEVEVTYLARWRDRIAIYREMLGGFSQVTGLGIPIPGHAYPESPNLSCESIGRVMPVGINRDFLAANPGEDELAKAIRRWNYPKWVLIPVTYKPLDYAYSAGTANDTNQIDPSDPIVGCRQTIEANNTFIVVSSATMEILAGRLGVPPARQLTPKVQQTTDGIPANSVTFTLEYPRVPRNPWPFLRPYLGCVNLYAMWGLPPGHVLFAGLTVNTTFGYDGPETSCNLSYIGNLTVGWNETIDDDGVIKAKVFLKSIVSSLDDAKYPFPSADLMIPLQS